MGSSLALIVLGLLTATVCGTIAVVIAVVQPRKRAGALVLAAPLFLPVAILGDRPIGVVFLAVTVSCLIGAVISRHPNSTADTTDS